MKDRQKKQNRMYIRNKTKTLIHLTVSETRHTPHQNPRISEETDGRGRSRRKCKMQWVECTCTSLRWYLRGDPCDLRHWMMRRKARTKTGPFATAYWRDAAGRGRSRNARRTHCCFGFNWGFCRQGPWLSFIHSIYLIQFAQSARKSCSWRVATFQQSFSCAVDKGSSKVRYIWKLRCK